MIYCCYPGTGKSYAARLRNDLFEYRYDFPQKELLKDVLTDEQQNELDNYYEERGKELKVLSNEYHHLLLQSDFRLFIAMERKNIPYTIVIPDYRIPGMKDVMLDRYKKRGTTSANFINSMIESWDANMEAFEKKDAPKIYLKEGQYVLDILD